MGTFNKTHHIIQFCTNSFTLQEVVMLENTLTEKGIFSNIHCKLKSQYIFYTNKKMLMY